MQPQGNARVVHCAAGVLRVEKPAGVQVAELGVAELNRHIAVAARGGVRRLEVGEGVVFTEHALLQHADKLRELRVEGDWEAVGELFGYAWDDDPAAALNQAAAQRITLFEGTCLPPVHLGFSGVREVQLLPGAHANLHSALADAAALSPALQVLHVRSESVSWQSPLHDEALGGPAGAARVARPLAELHIHTELPPTALWDVFGLPLGAQGIQRLLLRGCMTAYHLPRQEQLLQRLQVLTQRVQIRPSPYAGQYAQLLGKRCFTYNYALPTDRPNGSGAAVQAAEAVFACVVGELEAVCVQTDLCCPEPGMGVARAALRCLMSAAGDTSKYLLYAAFPAEQHMASMPAQIGVLVEAAIEQVLLYGEAGRTLTLCLRWASDALDQEAVQRLRARAAAACGARLTLLLSDAEVPRLDDDEPESE